MRLTVIEKNSSERIDIKLLLKLYPLSFFISVGLVMALEYWTPWFAIFFIFDAVCISMIFAFLPFFAAAILLNRARVPKRYTLHSALFLLLISTVVNSWILVKTTTFLAQAGVFD